MLLTQSPEVNWQGSKPGNIPYFLLFYKVVVMITKVRGRQTFSGKGQRGTISGLAGHRVSVPAPQGHRYGMKVARGNVRVRLCSRRTRSMKTGSQLSVQAAPRPRLKQGSRVVA